MVLRMVMWNCREMTTVEGNHGTVLTHARRSAQLRDLRLLDPQLSTSYPSAILARDDALVLNLEFIKVSISHHLVRSQIARTSAVESKHLQQSRPATMRWSSTWILSRCLLWRWHYPPSAKLYIQENSAILTRNDAMVLATLSFKVPGAVNTFVYHSYSIQCTQLTCSFATLGC